MAFYLGHDDTSLLSNAATPFNGIAPWTVSFWLYPQFSSTSTIVGLNTTTASNSFVSTLYLSGPSSWGNFYNSVIRLTGGVCTINAWNFVIFREAGTYRWIEGISNGSTFHANSTATVGAPTAAVSTWLGGVSSNQCTGFYSDFWWMYGDCNPSGNVQIPDDLLMKLAYYGPFSVREIGRNVGEYLRLDRVDNQPGASGSIGERIGSNFYQRYGKQNWQLNGGANATLTWTNPYTNKYVRPFSPFKSKSWLSGYNSGSTVTQRRTLAPIGTRVGVRQTMKVA